MSSQVTSAEIASRPQSVVAPPVVAPLSGWRRMMADTLAVGSATTVCHALGAATSLLLRLLLSPAQMGIWQALKLLLSYGNYANLGISKGATRELSVALGNGQTAAARRGLNLAFTVNVLSSLLYAAVLATAGVWIAATSGSHWANAWAVGLVAVGGLVVLSRHVTFHVTILRAQQAFTTTSRLSILEAVLTLSVCGLATWRWGLPGLYGGTLAVMLGSWAFLWRRAGAVLRPAWDTAEIRRLIGIGAPILLAGSVASLFRSLDKLMILGYLSDREVQLGCYSLTIMVTTQLYGLGNMLAMVMAPRYAESFGRHGNRRSVAALAARASELQAAAMALPAALALVVGPPLLAKILPDYRPGLPPLVWLVPGVVLLSLALHPSQYLVAVDRQRRALGAVLVATALAALGNHMALRGGFGLVGVAAATGAGYAVYFVLLSAVSVWADMDRAGWIRYVAMHALALVPTLSLALLLWRFRPTLDADWPTVVAEVAAVVAVWTLCVGVGWRHGGWREQLRRGTH